VVFCVVPGPRLGFGVRVGLADQARQFGKRIRLKNVAR
jgi:hypothetical protein